MERVVAGVAAPSIRGLEPGEGTRRNGEPHLGGVAWPCAHGREGGERAKRPAGVLAGAFQVGLDDLTSRAITDVADLHHHREVVVAGPGSIRRWLCRLVLPPRVAEPVPETEQGLAGVPVV